MFFYNRSWTYAKIRSCPVPPARKRVARGNFSKKTSNIVQCCFENYLADQLVIYVNFFADICEIAICFFSTKFSPIDPYV